MELKKDLPETQNAYLLSWEISMWKNMNIQVAMFIFNIKKC